MNIIKSFLMIILVVLMIGGGLYVGKRYIPQSQLENFQKIQALIPQLQMLQPQVQLALGQAGNLISSTQQIGKVLGVDDTLTSQKAKIIDSKQPLHQQVVEKVRYEYCKQVMEDYEKRNSSEISK